MPEPGSVLIVGAGTFGASTAYHLSLTHPSPSQIMLLDRTPLPPRPAASTDINKIVREDYSSAFYMALAVEAMQAWLTMSCLRNEVGERLFKRTGWVAVSKKGSDVARRIRENFGKRGVTNAEDVDLEQEIRERWSMVFGESDLSAMESAYFNPNPGIADAGVALEKMAREAMDRGVRFAVGDAVELVLEDGKAIGVRTLDGIVHKAEKIILATGAWTSALMASTEDKLDLPDSLRVESQVVAAGVCVVHYKLEDVEYEELKNMPVVIFGESGDLQPPPARSRLLKFTNAVSFTNTVTTASGRKISAPPTRDQGIVGEKLKKETIETHVRKVMPRFADRKVEYWRLCWDSIAPKQDHVICRHPDERLSNVYFAIGGSFHSYKFLPVIGKYVSNVVQGVSNGEERHKAWSWKMGNGGGRGAHEKAIPRRELCQVECE
ncbi:FAD dependent oxidoreductase [Lineolata rhizophorae]|uniref:FAD dependent oxidoreductase n=1 Tax=Lineolata rhizophorae TaxID=578093 RepID=A0A6A6NZD2_9PEZI|nr:FAD dependent oxidoreductase [Lineolata rhizophorae]